VIILATVSEEKEVTSWTAWQKLVVAD